MNLLGACYILKQAEEGGDIPSHIINKAKAIVAVAQAEFIAMKAQTKS